MTEQDYYPPRASSGARFRTGLRLAFRRLVNPLLGRIPLNLPGWLRGDPLLAGMLSVIPGLGHLYVGGKPGKALAFFGIFFLLAAWAILFGPEDWAWLVAALPLSFHNWVIMDSYSRALARNRLPRPAGWESVKISFLWTLLLVLVYTSALAATNRYGAVIRLNTGVFEPSFSRGDRLLVRRQRSFRRGDLVYAPRRGGFERVVALPGEQVNIEADGIFIAGKPLPAIYYPLSREIIGDARIFGAQAVVPEGSYCVFFPSRYGDGNWGRQRDAATYWLQQYMTGNENIAGKVILRYSPDVRRFD
ncbi:MAG: hypothetical protein HY796_03035 [Elusimicrobia bacterium]|nr:hypothetical protein [Elusimicrobiota bacterium]